MSNHSNTLLAAFITFVFTVSFILICGSYYAAYEATLANIVRSVGFENSGNLFPIDHGFLLISIFSVFSDYVDLPWWGILHLFMLFVGFFFWNLILVRLLNSYPNFYKVLIILLIDILFLSYFLLRVTNIGTSFIILFPSLFLLLNRRQYKLSAYMLCLIYTAIFLGILMRMQIFVFALFLAMGMHWIANNRISLAGLRNVVLPITAFVILYVLFNFFWKASDNYGIQFFDKYELTFFDLKNVIKPSAGVSSKDDLKYFALMEKGFIDSHTMPEEYLEGQIKYDSTLEYLLSDEFVPVYKENIFNALFQTFVRSKLWLIYMLLFSYLAIISWYYKSYYVLVINILINGFYISTLLFLMPFILFEERFLIPFLSINALILVYGIFHLIESLKNFKLRGYIIIASVFFVCLAFRIALLTFKSAELKYKNNIVLNTHKVLDELTQKGYFVLRVEPPWSVRHILSSPEGIDNDSIITLQYGELSYLPPVCNLLDEYFAYYEMDCSKEDVACEHYCWEIKSELLHSLAGNAFLVTNKGYVTFLIYYLKTFYDVELYDLKYYKPEQEIQPNIEIVSYSSRHLKPDLTLQIKEEN